MIRQQTSFHSRRRNLGGMPAGLVLKTLPLAVALCFCPPGRADINPATAGLPMGGTVAAGSVAGDLTGNKLTLTQTGNRAIVDWLSFNIDAGKTVEFVQPSINAAVLNRVPAGAGMSQIYGTLSANGMVLLMNPNGVLFGQGATINVGSLIASTGAVNVSRFMDDVNDGVIAIAGATGSVRNEGSITAQNAGLVALVAPSVVNHGSITATGGRIALAGTDRATVTLNGGLYEFALPAGATGTSVSNDAGASLAGAQILISTGDVANLVSGVINLEGVQQASSTLVVNGDVVLLKSALDAPSVSGSSNRIDVSPGVRVRDAISIAKTGAPGAGATVVLKAGDHIEQVSLNKANLTLQGETGARLLVPDAAEVNGITLGAANVTVENLEIAGPINQPYYDYYATPRANIHRGIAVADGVTGFTIRNNKLHDLRTGILIHGRNSTGSVTSNLIENTKSGISVQYTDASGIAITGNSQGTVGNEWGLNLHLNGHLDGTGTILSNTTPIAAAPTLSWQQALLGLSGANGGWTVQDQGYTASNRTHVQVAGSGAASNQGSRLTPINTVQGGIDAVVHGGTVKVASGSYTQTSTLNVNKPLTLSGAGEATTTIDARGITAGYGMLVNADDVTLRDFTFYGPSALYNSAYGIKVSPSGTPDARLRNFTIMNVTSRGAGKAELDLNGVDGALIDHVTLNGAPVGNDAGTTQGAGLQITDSANVTVRYSTTLNNAWGGLALYQANRSYNQRVNNISIEGNNQFGEINPVYLQDESALHDFGTLNIAGFGYAVRNAASADSGQYTWLQATQQKSYDFAVNLPGAPSSYVQGWDGGSRTQSFEVGIGNLAGGGTQAMSIATALAQSGSGATIRVGAGTYNENLGITKALTLEGAGVGQTVLKSTVAGEGNAVTISNASNVTLSDLSIEQYAYGLRMDGVANNVTVNRLAFKDNTYGMRNGTATRADNFRMLNSSITGGQIGVQTYNGYTMTGGAPVATGSFANALFENVTIDGPTFKGFYLETARDLTLRDVTVTNAGNYGAPATSSQHMKYGSAIDINLKYDNFNSVTLQNVVVRNSGASSGDASRAAVVIKTRGVPGDSSYAAAPASLNSVDIIGGTIEDSGGVGLRVETLSNGVGGQPAVTINGTRFGNNGQDIVVDATRVDARGAVFVGAADGYAIEDRVTHALDSSGRGRVTWGSGQLYVTQNSGSVQRGVNAAAAGETVHVADGSYAEQVLVDRRLDLLFGNTSLQGLTLQAGAADSGIGGRVTAQGAGGISFQAPVRLLADTRLTTTGANISLDGHISNAAGGPYSLTLTAGSGGTRGNVSMSSGGSETSPLNLLEVSSNRYSLSDTLWVQSYQINALGLVALSNHTLRALDTAGNNTLTTSGDVTGSTISLGSVAVTGGGDVAVNVSAGGNATVAGNNITGTISGVDVAVTAQGSANVDVVATQTATLAADTVVGSVSAPAASVDAGAGVQLTLNTQTATVHADGQVNLSGSASSLSVDAPGGSVSGNFSQVSNAGDGVFTVNGRPELGQTLSENASNNRVLPERSSLSGGGPADTAGGVNPPGGGTFAQLGGVSVARGSPAQASGAIDRGQSVEIDLSPGNEKEQK